jgi:YfiR/HmsC-like
MRLLQAFLQPRLPAALSKRRRVQCLLAGCLAFIAPLALSEETGVSKEYQIKAAFVYNFTKFVEWPERSFADASSPIVIGAFCPQPVSAELERVVRDRKVNGRSVVVKKLDAAEEARSTHVLFICASQEAQIANIESAISGLPVVTVGESARFVEAGGMIYLVREDDKVRFEINMQPAERRGVKVSAQLQKLARLVRRAQ